MNMRNIYSKAKFDENNKKICIKRNKLNKKISIQSKNFL